jgi:5-methylcytosine-specific restriction endonuclease McrA
VAQRNFKPTHAKATNSRSFNGRKKIEAMYDHNWEKYRKRFLAVNPTCYACGAVAIVVDHLRPHQGDETLFKKLDNHIPLCIVCHNTVTSLFDRRFRAGNSIQKKIDWLSRNRIVGGEWEPKRVKVLDKYP